MAAEATAVPLVIDGQDYAAEKTFEIKSPATGAVVYKSGGASVADAAKAVDAAAEALKTWRKTTPQERQDILLKAAEIMSSRRQELTKYMVDETGSAPGWADFNINISVGMLKDVAGRISTLAGSFPATANPSRSAIVLREPYGVVLSVAPWYGTPSCLFRAYLVASSHKNPVALTWFTGMPRSSSAPERLRSPSLPETQSSSRPLKAPPGRYGQL